MSDEKVLHTIADRLDRQEAEIERLEECRRVLADIPSLGALYAQAQFGGEDDATDEEVEIAGWIKRREEALDAVDTARAAEAKGE